MATNLALDDKLIEQAVKVGKHASKREAVTAALREYVNSRKRLGLLEWVGKVEYLDDYDSKKGRQPRRSG